MFHTRKLANLLPLACLALVVACGGSDDDKKSNGEFTTSVPTDKPLGSLSDSEADQLCEDLGNYIENSSFGTDAQVVSCRAAGLFAAVSSGAQTDAAAQAACKSAYDDCMAAPSETTQECSKPDASCMATVDDYTACIDEAQGYFEQVKQLFPPCDQLSLDDYNDIAGGPPAPPAACEALDMKCPDGPSVIPDETE
jgi:hypothetical protein